MEKLFIRQKKKPYMQISKEKFIGRNNLDIPEAIRNSIPLSKKIGLTTEGIVALKNTIKILPESKGYIDFLISVEYEKEMAEKNINKYSITENVAKEFEEENSVQSRLSRHVAELW